MAFGEEPRFSFQHLADRRFKFLQERDTKDLLQKWSLLGGMKATTFGYDQFFQIYHKERFFKDFFTSPVVGSALQVVGSGRSWRSIGCVANPEVEAESVPCQVLSMEFFDRLSQCGVVRPSGDIRKCFDEFVDDFTISDELRKVLLMEDFEHYGIFSGDDRKEFVFRIFSHLCLGGSICQHRYFLATMSMFSPASTICRKGLRGFPAPAPLVMFEDAVEPYLSVSRSVYKELVSVVKEIQTNQLKVASSVFQISLKDKGTDVFPSSGRHIQSFAYAIIDPVKRHVTIWWHDWNFGF